MAGLLYVATAALVAVGLLATIFHDRALGILVLAFLLAAYTVVRHLAGIELHESGRVVLQGLARPVRRNRTLLFYLAGDIAILSLVLLAGRALLDLQDGVLDVSLKTAWLRAAPMDLFIPFALLVLFRSYSRVWYLARVSEYAATGLAVTLGYAIAGGLQLLVAHSRGEVLSLLLYYLLLAGLAAPAVVMTRAALRVVQDLMQWRTRGLRPDGAAPARALVCGAGYRTTLFLRQIAFPAAGRAPVDVVGLVSEDAAITGHFVHGVSVVGTCHELPALVVQHRIDRLYLVEAVADAELERLRRTLAGLPVRVIRWDIVETELPPHG